VKKKVYAILSVGVLLMAFPYYYSIVILGYFCNPIGECHTPYGGTFQIIIFCIGLVMIVIGLNIDYKHKKKFHDSQG